MPNPRANRPLTLDQVTADLKSLSQPAQALFDMMAGGLRGSAVGTFGAPGDIETLGRMGLNAAGGSFNPAMPSRSGRAFQPVSEEPFFPSSEELAKRFAPTIPNGDPVRRKSAEPFEELGQFAPLPMSGKALKVLPYALGRGTGMATKEAARAINDAMIHQTGPLSQGPLSMLAPKGAVSHVFEPNPNWKTNTVNFGKPTPGIMIPSKMSNVREAVRDLKGNYGARRVERAADEIPNLERMFKEDALKEAFTGDNASAMITLSPAEFERYAIELEKRKSVGPKMAKLAKEGDIDKYTVPTDEYIRYLQRLNEGFSDVPYLNLAKDEVGLPTMPRVSGHEGRHRSRALAEQGAPTSLVQINPRGDLREGMPRRTQEEFIEALKEELERSNRLVLPEKDGEYRRPAIELPEPYAEGGSVNMAAGGLLKGIKAIRKGALNAERSMPARGALSFADEPVGGPSVIKEKGGNWMSGSAEKAVGPLLQKGMINNREIPYGPEFDAAIRQRIEDLKQAASQPGYQGGAGRVVEHLERDLENPRANEAAINRWVQSNLTNYIKKEMATPEDTVRKLAEEGIVHIPSEQVGTNRYKAPDRRATMGGEQLGQSDAAKAWEDASDVALRASRIGDLSGDYKEPWMANADPSTKIYSPGREMDALGFDHIVDVLKEDLATGRIRPEQLSKVSMEQAVRRTYEYDQEKARKMAEAQIKITEGMPVHKEYPEGYKWVELAQPKELPAGWRPSASVGHYYDEAGNFQRHPGEKILEDALKYEGDTMGHCVGGYCPDVLEGRKRIYSLRDARGEPHVTIEVQPMRGSELGRYAADLPEGEDVATMKNPPLKIVQIKGKGNRAPKEEYLPFVQDFVRGGKWSDVGDLQNTGLIKAQNNQYITEAEAKEHFSPRVKKAIDFLQSHPAFEEQRLARAKRNKDLLNMDFDQQRELERIYGAPITPNSRYSASELFSIIQRPEENISGPSDLYPSLNHWLEEAEKGMAHHGYTPPTEGMKAGGSVHISDNPDTMMMELGDKHFQVGGIVDAAARAAKAAKAAQMKKAMKASEALAQIEGKNLNITQADRTKVGEGLLGGPGFSGLQLQEGPHKQAGAVWGVKNPGTAKTMLGGLKNPLGNEYFTTMIGSPTQHQSNQMVFDKLYGKFKSEAKKGNLDPELQQKINERLANAVDKDGNPVFPPDVDILSKDFKKIANTFDRRSIAGNLIGGVGVGGRKGQIIDYDKIIRDTTDPFLLDMPSGSLGHRLWTPSGEIIERPDLHPAFPAIATGEDLGVEFTPAAQDILMAPWIENVRQTKGRNPGYMDWTRGRPPSVQVSDEILRKLEESGNKEGGAIIVKPKQDGQKFKPGRKPDQILKHGQAIPRGKDPVVDIGQMMPMMARGGEVNADDLILEERPL